MLSTIFHAWERRLAAITKDRVVRPFEWGLDWIPSNGHTPGTPPEALLRDWVTAAMRDSDAFFAATPAPDYQLEGEWLSFTSALETPHAPNNTVHARYFPASGRPGSADPRQGDGTMRAGWAEGRRAVVVLPQWNAGPDGHVALCRLLARTGISTVRLSLPYHDRRMPPELHRADYIVSANLTRTVQVCRQAVLDARRTIAWLSARGYDRIGILGTSLGSCLAMLTAAHEPLVRGAALNHVSPFFADVVWEGLSTAHVRQGLDPHVSLDTLRALWMPISPFPYLERLRGRRVLLVYAKYDLTFPVRLSRMLVDELRRLGVSPDVAVLPCGHYSTGVAPFSWLDGFVLARFLRRAM